MNSVWKRVHMHKTSFFEQELQFRIYISLRMFKRSEFIFIYQYNSFDFTSD